MNRLVIVISILVLSFVSCKNELSEAQKTEFTNKGKEIAQSTAKRMLSEVGKNMKEGGVMQAAAFCNAHASGITDEMAMQNRVVIKRTSHKLRNEQNAPNQREQEVIEQYLKGQTDSQELKPMVEKNADGSVQFYAPIMVADKCTVCHGVVNETLTVQNDSIIKNLYPMDKATGFKEGDIRGIWSITFPKP